MKIFNPFLISAMLFGLIAVANPQGSCAQQVYEGTQHGFAPFGSFSESGIDAITILNGNLHVEIPILSAKQRGGQTFSYRVVYEPGSWNTTWLPNPNPRQLPRGWWVVHLQSAGSMGLLQPTAYAASYQTETRTCTGYGPYSVSTFYQVKDPDGTQHQTANLVAPTGQLCDVSTLVGPALDGSGIVLDRTNWPPTATLKDGTKVLTYRDSNGNLASSTADTSGKNPVVEYVAPNVTYTSPAGRTTPAPQYVTWTVMDSSGTQQVYRQDFVAIDIQTNICAYVGGTNCMELAPFAMAKTSKITLPNGKAYQFTWTNGGYGDLTRIDLPTGGYITYANYTMVKSRPFTTDPTLGTTFRNGVGQRTTGPNGGTWNYTIPLSPNSVGVITDPLGNDETHTFTYFGSTNTQSNSRYETQVKSYSGSSSTGTLLRTVTKDYAVETNPVTSRLEANVRVIRETTTLENGQTSKVETDFETSQYTYNNATFTATRLNPIERREYDFGPSAPGPLLRRTDYTYLHTGNSTYLNLNIVNRPASVITYDGAGTTKAQTQYEYDNYTAGIQASGATQHDSSFGTSYLTRGNVTATKRWRNTDGAWLVTRNQYDDAGNILSMTDPLNHTTQFDYSDSWTTQTGGSACPPVGGPGKIYVSRVTNALNQASSSQYFSCTGPLGAAVDLNGKITTTSYDLFDRPLTISYPDGGSKVLLYDDTARTAETKTYYTSTSFIDSIVSYDQLGRSFQTNLASDPDGPAFSVVTYDQLSRPFQNYNPTRCTSPTTNCGETTWGYTTTAYDALGRIASITLQDGQIATTSYTGNCTTITDPAGKSRKSCTDGLGRLVQVFEDSAGLNYETDYVYDAIGNLLTVNQKGNDPSSANWRTRTFTYNSLSQLLIASNPESGTIAYVYDANGNLTTKTSPAPNQTGSATVTVAYCYDALNRLTSKAYTTSTTCPQTSPVASYSYDQASFNGLIITNGIGRRTGMTDQSGNGFEAWSYDSMGRVISDKRTIYTGTASYSKTIPYTYNLDGSLASIATPSWPDGSHPSLNTYVQGGAGRPTVLNTVFTNFVNNIHYAPSGAICYMQAHWGRDFSITSSFNNRLQPSTIYAIGQTSGHGTPPAQCASVPLIPDDPYTSNMVRYTYSFIDASGHNNGNVASITDGLTANYSQTYTYDSLNRLKTAQTTSTHATDANNCWAETYNYDPWGNLLKLGADTVNQSAYIGCSEESGFDFTNFTGANNRITASGYGYDAAGNLITNSGVGTQTFDAENHLVSAGGVTYTYDGDGKRVMKSSGTIYWYGMNSDALMETDLSNNMTFAYYFLNGARVARSNLSNSVQWYFTDHLGTSRTVWSLGGVDRSDFYPFGGERVHSASTTNRYKFTGKERDSESGLDDFNKRYYGGNSGRMMSPDPVFFQAEMLVDPQRFNGYAYARNNPLLYVDPSGEAIQLSNDPAERQKQLDAICSAAKILSDKCSYYLYANPATDSNGNTTYYVGIYGNGADGTGTSFQNLNDIAGAFGSIINDQRVVQLDTVAVGTTITDNEGGHKIIGPVDAKTGATPGATYIGQDGKWHIALLDPSTAPGTLPPSWMSLQKPGFLDQGIILAHEIGHLRGEWGLESQPWRFINYTLGLDRRGNGEAIMLENKVRRARDPNAQTRKAGTEPTGPRFD